MKASTGLYYGTSSEGGTGGAGDIWQFDPGTGAITEVANFSTVGVQMGDYDETPAPITDDAGNIYGFAQYGGAHNNGALWKWSATGGLVKLADFDHDTTGQQPQGKLARDAATGTIFGVTFSGGEITGRGTLWQWTQADGITVLEKFDSGSAMGESPSDIVRDPVSGTIYGLTTQYDQVTFARSFLLWQRTSAGVMSVLATLPESAGEPANLTLGATGELFGSTQYASINRLWRYTAATGLTTLKSFSGDEVTGIVRASDGSLFFASDSGGTVKAGAIWKRTPAGVISILASFDQNHSGYMPMGSMVLDEGNSTLSGCTKYGPDATDGGAVWKCSTATATSNITVLAKFAIAPKGGRPKGVLADGAGNVFGIEEKQGTLWRWNAATGIYNFPPFDAKTIGVPQGDLVTDGAGTIFGIGDLFLSSTLRSTLWKWTPSGGPVKLASFGSGAVVGDPFGIVRDPVGNIYGLATSYHPTTFAETDVLWKWSVASGLVKLATFSEATTGYGPNGDIVVDATGAVTLYGTCYGGGANSGGTLWKWTQAGGLQVVASFGQISPTAPSGGLARAADGTLYGVTQLGGANFVGQVWKWTASGGLVAVADFDRATTGEMFDNVPAAVMDANGLIWGEANQGGANHVGTVWTYDTVGAGGLTTAHTFVGDAGFPEGPRFAIGHDGAIYGTARDVLWRVGPPPSSGKPSVVTLPASYVSATHVVIEGGVNAMGNNTTSVTFNYGLSAASLNTVVSPTPNSASGTSATPVNVSLTGLTPNTTYFYRLSATNSVGTSDGDVLSFKTSSLGPPGIVTKPATAISHDTATLNAAITAKGVPVAASFEWGATTAFGMTAAAIPASVTGTAPANVGATLTGLLSPHTKYYYRAKGLSDNGNAVGPTLSFTTLNRPPVGVPDSFAALPSAKLTMNVLLLDTDPDNDTLSILSFTQPGAAVGTVTKAGTELVFTAAAGFTGGSFTYVAADAFGGKSAPTTVTLTLGTCTLGADVTVNSDTPSYDLSVTANAPWSIVESLPWLTFTPPGPSDTSAHFFVAPNPSDQSRTGTVKIGGKTHTVTQNGIPAAPVLNVPTTIPNAAVSSNYDLIIPTQNGPVTYTPTNLPPGLTLSNATGRITGYPTTSGTYNVSITAKNIKGTTASPINFSIAVLPFPVTMAGAYSAVIEDSALTDGLGGLLTFNVTSIGTVTGTLKLGSGTHGVTGRLNTAVNPLSPDPDHARLTTNVVRAGKPTVVLTVNMNSTATDFIAGDVTLPGPVPSTATLHGSRHVWNATTNQASDFNGYFTTALQPTTSGPSLPQGDGFITFTITSGGGVTWSGQLADGTTINPTSATLWANGELPLFTLLYSSKGSLNQKIAVAGTTRIVSGSPHWRKSPQTARAYAAGFALTLQAAGSEYVPPGVGKTLLNITAPGTANIAFTDGNIQTVTQFADLDQVFNVSTAHLATFSTNPLVNPALVKLTRLDVAKGLFTGTLTLKDPNPFNGTLPQVARTLTFNGVLLPTISGGTGTGYGWLPAIGGPPANVTTSPQTSFLVRITP